MEDKHKSFHPGSTGSNAPQSLAGQISQALNAHQGRTAIREARGSITYAQLQELVGRIAGGLISLGVVPGVAVGVSLERSINYIALMIAIIQVGGVYVPLSNDQPSLRLITMLKAAGCCCLVHGNEPIDLAGYELTTISLSELLRKNSVSTVRVRPTDVACIAFTSGSTGTPKGAIISSRGVINHIFSKIEVCKMNPGDSVAQTSEPAFVIHIWQMLAPLIAGAEIVIYSKECMSDPASFLMKLASDRASVVQLVPTVWRLLLDCYLQENIDFFPPRLILTGETVPSDLCRDTLRAVPGLTLINAYGQTECSDDVAHYVVTREEECTGSVLPIGYAISNVELEVIRDDGSPCEFGEIGELLVGGAAVANGYINDSCSTLESFITNAVGQRFFRTGDLARSTSGGLLECLGRKDRQIKLAGQRVELLEVEHALRQIDGVDQAVVLSMEKNNIVFLVGFIKVSKSLSTEDIKWNLKGILPDYMIPTVVQQVGNIPVNNNGKTDRSALRGIYEQSI